MNQRTGQRLARRLRHTLLPWVAPLAVCLAASTARADTHSADAAAADAVFNAATARMKAGDYAAACPKFAESQRLDPTAGTLLNLGRCYEMWGKFASAYGSYGDAEAMALKAGDKVRSTEAASRAETLQPKLSRMTITIAPDGLTAGLAVTRDGRPIGEAVWGTAIPVDAGEYAIEASAPGKKTWAAKAYVPATPGGMTVVIPALEAAPVEAPKPVGVSAEPQGDGGSTRRTAGLVVGGIGVAGVIVGGIFGGLTLSKTSDSKAYCSTGSPIQCDPAGLQLRSEAKGLAKVSDIGLAVGGAAMIAGVVLFVTAPTSKAPSTASALRMQVGPTVGSAAGGLLLRGEW
jgi:serine/threonine-protein kinase